MSNNKSEKQIVDSSVITNATNVANTADVSTNMEEKLCTYITQTLLPPDSGIELKVDDDLLSIDYLDSMQFMRLVQFTEETYSIKIPPEDMLIENFQTVGLLTNYLTDRMARE